jgi:hypothetical protein
MPSRNGGFTAALAGTSFAFAKREAQDSRNGNANTAPAPRKAARRESGAFQFNAVFQIFIMGLKLFATKRCTIRNETAALSVFSL